MEDTTYYKLLKLSSGDNIICGTEDNCVNFTDRGMISITNPVVLNVLRTPKGRNLVETYILIPWFSFASGNVYEISTDQIITAIDIKESLKSNYFSYLEQRALEEEIEDGLSDDFDNEDEIQEIEEFLETLGEVHDDEHDYDGRDDTDTTRSRRGTRTLH